MKRDALENIHVPAEAMEMARRRVRPFVDCLPRVRNDLLELLACAWWQGAIDATDLREANAARAADGTESGRLAGRVAFSQLTLACGDNLYILVPVSAWSAASPGDGARRETMTTTYSITNGSGTIDHGGMTLEQARAAAQRRADERGEAITIYTPAQGDAEAQDVETVQPRMTTTETVTLQQVRALRNEAAAAGDSKMVDLCERAELALYDADRGANAAPRDQFAPALEQVVKAISDAESMAAE